MESGKFSEKESLEIFGKIVPRNPGDWFGGIVLYSTVNETLFDIAFGSGDNLSYEDEADGCDDYIMVTQYKTDSTALPAILSCAKADGWINDSIGGLKEIDGGQWLLRRKEWTDGDIRRFIIDALDFAGYGVPKGRDDEMYKDLIFIGADYGYNKENDNED